MLEVGTEELLECCSGGGGDVGADVVVASLVPEVVGNLRVSLAGVPPLGGVVAPRRRCQEEQGL